MRRRPGSAPGSSATQRNPANSVAGSSVRPSDLTVTSGKPSRPGTATNRPVLSYVQAWYGQVNRLAVPHPVTTCDWRCRQTLSNALTVPCGCSGQQDGSPHHRLGAIRARGGKFRDVADQLRTGQQHGPVPVVSLDTRVVARVDRVLRRSEVGRLVARQLQRPPGQVDELIVFHLTSTDLVTVVRSRRG